MGKMFANILCIKMLEALEALAVKENQYRYDLCVRKTSGLVAMDFALADLMFFEFG